MKLWLKFPEFIIQNMIIDKSYHFVAPHKIAAILLRQLVSALIFRIAQGS
jgi:hypothetical protein